MADFVLHEVVGFDYAQAALELSHKMTYEHMCEILGYENRSSIRRIIQGMTPDHVRGEALYALYRDTFGKKPPLNVSQKQQITTTNSA